jgi:multicomponent Na+:H+ antiporter subunit G
MTTLWATSVDVLGATLAVLGASLMAVSSIGLHRFRDPAVRLHVAAKASSSGMLSLLLGLGLRSGSLAVGLELAMTGLFLLVTVPLATHGLARSLVRGAPPA